MNAPYVGFGHTVFVNSRSTAVIRKVRASTWKLGIGLLPTGVFDAARCDMAETVAAGHFCIGRNTILHDPRLADGEL